MQPDIELYWLQAQHNCAHARADLAHGFFDGCVAGSQQTAELALKALVVQATRAPAARTHSLAVLETALGASGVALPAGVRVAIASLPEGMWTRSRYPDPLTGYVPARDIATDEAQAALAHAEVILSWVQQQLAALAQAAGSTGTSSPGSETP